MMEEWQIWLCLSIHAELSVIHNYTISCIWVTVYKNTVKCKMQNYTECLTPKTHSNWGQKPQRPVLASRSLSIATSVFFGFFRNEEVCEPASLREGSMQLWKGGANGNACGWSDYDKYLLRQSGTGGQRERQRWKALITFETEELHFSCYSHCGWWVCTHTALGSHYYWTSCAKTFIPEPYFAKDI